MLNLEMTRNNNGMTWTSYAYGVPIEEVHSQFVKRCYFSFFLNDKFEFTYQTLPNITPVVLSRCDILEEIEKENKEFVTYYGELSAIILYEVIGLAVVLDGNNCPDILRHREFTHIISYDRYSLSGMVDICFDLEHVHKLHTRKDRRELRNNFSLLTL